MKRYLALSFIVFFLFISGCGNQNQKNVQNEKKYEWVLKKEHSDNGLCGIKYNEKIYIGTDKGLFILDDKNELERVSFVNLDKRSVNEMKISKNGLILCTDRGAGFYSNRFIFRSSMPVNSAYTVDNSTVLLGGDLGLIKSTSSLEKMDVLDHKNSFFNHYLENDDLSKRLLKVNSITGNKDNIFLGTDEGLIITDKDLKNAKFYYSDYVVPSMGNELIRHEGNSPISGSIISSLLIVDDVLWIATNKGISMFNIETETWEKYSSKHKERIMESGLWKNVEVLGNCDLKGNYVTVLKRWEDKIYVGTNKGLNIYDIKNKRFSNDLYRFNILDIFIDNKTLILFTEVDGIKIYELQEVKDENSNR